MPGGLVTFVTAVAILFPGFAALVAWGWWNWRER